MIAAECYFLDVGQATAQAIDLGDGSAIVIDCGRSSRVLRELLRTRLGIKRIALLVISHNHSDHIGGAPGIVQEYRKCIGCIGLLQDCSAADLLGRRAFDMLRQECESGNIPEPVPLVRSNRHRRLYPISNQHGPGPHDLSVELLFPNIFENIQGQATGDSNVTSAVVLLRCGDRRILFPGDAKLDAWKAIRQKRDGPIQCDVIAVPHHGGQIVRSVRKGEDYADFSAAIRPDLEWLYSDCIRSQYAVISVGTSNDYKDKHPTPAHVEALRTARSKILCTQITDRCHEDVEQLRPGVLSPRALPGESNPATIRTAHGASRDVACAGTILVQIQPDKVNVERYAEFQSAIDEKLSPPAGHALCRE